MVELSILDKIGRIHVSREKEVGIIDCIDWYLLHYTGCCSHTSN